MITGSGFRLNRGRLVRETLRLLNDPNGERFDRERVAVRVNEAALDLVLDGELIVETVTFSLDAFTREADIARFAAGAGNLREFGRPLRVRWNAGPALQPMTTLELDFMGVTRSRPGEPRYWVNDLTSPGRIAVFPVPNRTAPLEVAYVALPSPMGTDDDFPDLPPFHHFHLCRGAAARLLEEGDETDLERSLVFETEFRRAVREAVAFRTRSDTPYAGFSPC